MFRLSHFFAGYRRFVVCVSGSARDSPESIEIRLLKRYFCVSDLFASRYAAHEPARRSNGKEKGRETSAAGGRSHMPLPRRDVRALGYLQLVQLASPTA